MKKRDWFEIFTDAVVIIGILGVIAMIFILRWVGPIGG